MHCVSVGFCCLVLVNFSIALNQTIQVTQMPRFYGVKTNQTVLIYCVGSHLSPHARVFWYKANVTFSNRTKVDDGGNVMIKGQTDSRSASISLKNLRTGDSGVYFCKFNGILGPGTELQVINPSRPGNALHRSKLKDALIFVQGLILTVLVAFPLVCKHTLFKKEEAVYEVPEQNQIYEGLDTEHCGGGLYEDLSLYAPLGTAEAVWEQD